MKSNLQRACGLLFCNFYKLNRNIKLLILPLAFIVSSVSAQDIIFNVKTYKGGYNVSCNGSTDGNIDAIVVGGVPPYTYSWTNGATTQDLVNIGAGAYTLTVTDALNNSKSKSVTLFEADIIDVFLFPTLYEGGYHISKMGASDGAIATDVKGGAPPYSYLWNNGSKKANLSGLIAGAYSVTITDQNGCAVTKSITLLEPTPITINISATTYGSYNTSCFKSSDGNINVTVSGGMPPYKFNWSNGSFDEDLTNVPADEYKLLVYDANKATAEAQITLTQPDPLKLTLTSPLYPNDYNISCTGCFNGSITSQVQGGTMPATYLWKGKNVNGLTTANLSNLGPGDYVLTVTDANGCETVDKIFLFEPPANGWNKTGNSIDNTDFLGSTNNAPLVLKTANTEQLRISETGNIGIGTNNPQNKLDVNGNAQIIGDLYTSSLKLGNAADNIAFNSLTSPEGARLLGIGVTPIPLPSCTPAYTSGNVQFNRITITNSVNANAFDFRNDGTNSFIDFGSSAVSTSNPSTTIKINSYCSSNVDICSAGGSVYLCNTPNGKIGIGTNTPTEKLDVFGNIKLNSNQLYLKDDLNHGLGYFYNNYATTPAYVGKTIDGPVLYGYSGGGLGVIQGSTKNIVLSWAANGNVGIGIHENDNTNNYKLAVNGTIGAKELKIELTTTPWPDYVFAKEYKLMTIRELEQFVAKNQHLPNIPSSKDVDVNEGILIGDFQTKLLEKIEELTLYIIEQNKRIEELEKKIK